MTEPLFDLDLQAPAPRAPRCSAIRPTPLRPHEASGPHSTLYGSCTLRADHSGQHACQESTELHYVAEARWVST